MPRNWSEDLSDWDLRPAVTEVKAYWETKHPVVHDVKGNCLKMWDPKTHGEAKDRSWLETAYAEQLAKAEAKENRDLSFCGMCVVSMKASAAQIVPAAEGEVEVDLTGELAESIEIAKKKPLIDAVKAHAKVHYDTAGWDIVLETASDAEIAEVIGAATSENGAIKKVAKWAKSRDEAREEVRSA
jgi:hypothetical protein